VWGGGFWVFGCVLLGGVVGVVVLGVGVLGVFFGRFGGVI